MHYLLGGGIDPEERGNNCKCYPSGECGFIIKLLFSGNKAHSGVLKEGCLEKQLTCGHLCDKDKTGNSNANHINLKMFSGFLRNRDTHSGPIEGGPTSLSP